MMKDIIFLNYFSYVIFVKQETLLISYSVVIHDKPLKNSTVQL